ncbi:MAG: hypothetical protein WEA58_04550 [Balneolaceae bacterium]
MKSFHKNMGIFERIILGFLLFFFVYSVQFSFLPMFTSQLLGGAVVLIGVAFFLYAGDVDFSMNHSAKTVLLLWFILFIWVFLRTIQTDFQDLSLLINTVLLFEVFIVALFFTLWMFLKGFTFADMIRLVQMIIVVQGIFIIIYFLSWEFKEFTLLFIPEGGNLPALHPFRSRGLTNGAGAKLAAQQASGILFTAYLMLKAKNRNWLIFDILSIGILLISVFMTGRTGFLIIPIVAAFYTLYVLRKKLLPRNPMLTGAILPLLIIGAYFGIQLLFEAYVATQFDYDVFRSFNRWAFSEFQDLAVSGRSRTVDALINEHLFFPDKAGLFLVGDPTTYLVNRVDTDIGFVRRIFGIGLIGLTLTYLFVGNIFVQMFKNQHHFTERLLIVTFGIWIFILELKEPFVTDFRFASLYFMMFCYVCLLPVQNFNRVTFKDETGKN